VIKIRRIRWVGNMARMGDKGFWWENLRERDSFEDLSYIGV